MLLVFEAERENKMNKEYKQFDLFADLTGEKENGLQVEKTKNNIINIKEESMYKKKAITQESEERKIEGEQPTYRIALSEAKEKPNRGKAYTRTLKEYDEMISSHWLRALIDDIRAGDESKKELLPFRMAHYAHCKNNHRAQSDIDRSSFMHQTTVDVDAPEYVATAIQRAYEINKQEGLWKGHLLHMEYSARKKLHIDIRIPRGMTIEGAQKEYCRVMGIPYDESCTTPERFIYLSSDEDEIYRSPDWYRIPNEALDATVPNCDGQDAMFKKMYERNHDQHAQPSETVHEKLLPPPTDESADEMMYNGLPIKEIVTKYWSLHNGGQTPSVGDRNTKIFELACALRHILNFDREMLNRAIPNYEDFPQVEKMMCIDNALHEPRKYMPLKLKQVIDALKKEHAANPELMQALEEVEQENTLQYVRRLPKKMGLGVDAALRWLPEDLHVQALIAMTPALGALLTRVRLLTLGTWNTLNLQSFIVGEAGSGKSKFALIDAALMKHFYAESKENQAKNEKNRKEQERKRNAKDVPVFDLLPERSIPARHSMAQALDMLNAAAGQHCYTFSQEADIMSGNGRQAFADTSALRRIAFDGSSYSQAYKSNSASRLTIENVCWNITQCGTPDALYRAFPNVTDGELSRVAIAQMPDNTFAPLVVGRVFSERESNPLEQLGRLLPLMQGNIELKKLEKHAIEQIEKFRIECLKNDDKVRARMRVRIPTMVMRMVCALTACSFAAYLDENIDKAKTKPAWANGAQTAEDYLKANPEATSKYMKRVQNKSMMALYDVLTEYLTETTLYYFRTRIEQSYQSENYLPSGRMKKGKNDSVFERLPQIFTLSEAATAKGHTKADNSIRGMVFQWCKQGLIKNTGNGKYEKC